jgi:hypothetical protein
MRTFGTIAICLGLVMANPSASLGHEDPSHHEQHISPQRAESIARYNIADAVRQGRLSSSWTKAFTLGTEIETRKEVEYWVVELVNVEESDEAKRSLFVLVRITGEYAGYSHNRP